MGTGAGEPGCVKLYRCLQGNGLLCTQGQLVLDKYSVLSDYQLNDCCTNG